MKRALALLLCLTAGAAFGQEAAPGGTWQCHVADKTDGFLDVYQTVAEDGALLRTWGAWIQSEAFFDKKKARRDGITHFYLSARTDTGPTRAHADPPQWVDPAEALVWMHLVAPKRVKGPAVLMLSRPSRVGELYEPALSLSAYGGREDVTVEIAYRALKAFAANEPELRWTLHRHIGGDARWAQVAEGKFDMRKLSALAKAMEEARPAMANLRADYRKSCQYFPAPADNGDSEI